MISVRFNFLKYLYSTLCFLPLILFTLQHNSDKFQSEFKKGKQLKILVYSPSVSWSHAKFLGRIADTLVDAGHEVHFVKYIMSPLLLQRNETTKVTKIHIIEKSLENNEIMDMKDKPMVSESFTKKRQYLTIFDHPMHQFGPMMAMSCKETIKQPILLQKLTNERFDVGIAEMYDFCPSALFHKIGVRTKLTAYAIPLFQATSRIFGIPNFPSFMPNVMVPIPGLEHSFVSRSINFYNEMFDWLWNGDIALRHQEPVIRAEFGADFPDLKELQKNVSLAFFNSNPFLELPRPISNKIIYIGGLVDDHTSVGNKILEPKIQKIMDEAVTGAILFSFGSLADTTKLNNKMKSAIIKAFGRFPQIQFLWKLDSDTIKNLTKLPNVHTFEWLQQPAILGHPNLRAFISHCGQNSLTESARAGVPIIGIPLFGDQFYNADVAQKLGIGIQIDVNELSGLNAEQVLVEAIERILYQPKYQQNAKIISKKLKLTPFSPTERLVKWVEFAAEFGDLPELNLPGEKEMNWFVYYSLDVILFSIIVLAILFWVTFKCFKWILSSTINWFRKIESEERKQK
uniref:glucuronosyltransferase n=1 Tax=Meloidogyne incognita TaxID=6306 RepID=A0A914MHS6_MELIC